ncbi:MAG: RING-HC finger protein [Myxococcales bacterium]|nr:RING-HC finger protein [Myxococcales bacterium]USN51853.1 MAG: RING-HC finger protein [Myxococcales bacterium]
MRTPLHYFFAFFFLAFPLLSHDYPNNKENIKKQLIALAQGYKIYLPNQYACVCTKYLHKVFGSQLRREELRKLVALDNLIERLGTEQDEIITREFLNDLGPFEDQYAKNFFQNFCDTMELQKEYQLIEPSCSICWEKKPSHILLPCGHMPTCELCIKKIEDGECPLCRTKIDQSVPFAEIKTLGPSCIKCKDAQPNILFCDCNHMIECEKCNDNYCSVCRKECQNFVKVFLNDEHEV